MNKKNKSANLALTVLRHADMAEQGGIPMTVTGNGTLFRKSKQGVLHFLSPNIPGVWGLAPTRPGKGGARA